MKITYYKIHFIIFSLMAGLLIACTDLDETLYSEVSESNYYKSVDELNSTIYRPWSHFCGIMPVAQAPWLLQELTADGAAWPQKGRHGYDGGNWIRLHRHEWTSIDGQVEQAWALLFQGVGFANKLLADLENIDFERLEYPVSKEQIFAELKIYRAFCYWQIMDLYGEAPITESIWDKNPPSSTRKEMFEFIEKQIKENVDALSEDKITTYGRVSKWGAYALLARLYLNAEVYTGTPRWDDCLAACQALDGHFVLDLHWGDPFTANNDKLSTENIWVVPFDQIYAHGNGWYQRWFHYAHQKGWNLQSGTWNGLVTQPTFFDSFGNTDKRKTEGFLIGLQHPRKKKEDGTYYFDTSDTLKGSEEYNGKPLILVNTIKSMTEGEENSGARSIKYEIIEQSTADQDNDWVLFRYSDILFMKAEALIRKNGNIATQDAVDIINEVRARAFEKGDPAATYTIATLTMKELLAERGREFAFEGTRRSDMIRFNQFVTTDWWDKKASNDVKRNLFPIPKKQLDANPNLRPNAAN